jgi:succinate dehydrogenase / fumarate reductase cytochrome b subunit
MSKSGIFTSSLAKKYWMALTGLFLITFLVGHLLGNLQLITKTGEEGRRAFNEYAYFMGHNIFIKVLAYLTYFSILAHACIGLYLAVQNKKARPKNYAYNRPGTNSSAASRYMAILGTIILVFIVTHMANFWWKQKIAETVPLHYVEVQKTQTMQDPMTGQPISQEYTEIQALTTMGVYMPVGYINPETKQKEMQEPEGTKFKDPQTGLVAAEGYRDLHTVVMNFFGHTEQGGKANEWALVAVILYVVSMFVLMFHLWHGFGSAFQSLGLNHRKYNGLIRFVGQAFAIVVPLAFAIIPVMIYLNR